MQTSGMKCRILRKISYYNFDQMRFSFIQDTHAWNANNVIILIASNISIIKQMTKQLKTADKYGIKLKLYEHYRKTKNFNTDCKILHSNRPDKKIWPKFIAWSDLIS